MTQARIVQKSKNALQSGRYGTGQWVLEYNPVDAQRPDPLMGWAGSADTRRQLNLKFATLDAAKALSAATSASRSSGQSQKLMTHREACCCGCEFRASPFR